MAVVWLFLSLIVYRLCLISSHHIWNLTNKIHYTYIIILIKFGFYNLNWIAQVTVVGNQTEKYLNPLRSACSVSSKMLFTLILLWFSLVSFGLFWFGLVAASGYGLTTFKYVWAMHKCLSVCVCGCWCVSCCDNWKYFGHTEAPPLYVRHTHRATRQRSMPWIQGAK